MATKKAGRTEAIIFYRDTLTVDLSGYHGDMDIRKFEILPRHAVGQFKWVTKKPGVLENAMLFHHDTPGASPGLLFVLGEGGP